MIMKFCPNYTCVAYGHVVYTQTTRCVFCRWDLQPPRLKSESPAESREQPRPGEEVIVDSTSSRNRAPRAPVRQTA